MSNHLLATQQVLELATFCTRKGWLPATSGNLSVRVQEGPLLFAITRSGADKQNLEANDVILVNEHMEVQSSAYRPSAETIVHVELYRKWQCGCIVHVHTIDNNLISELYGDVGFVQIQQHELLKALGHWEENAQIQVPIVENFHELHTLGQAVRDASREGVPGVLVRNHGIYAWGGNHEEARRHLEAFEFLFKYLLQLAQYKWIHR